MRHHLRGRVSELAQDRFRGARHRRRSERGDIGSGADELVNTGYFGGVAIMGYDPVAYFTDNRAVKGSEEYSYDWLGTAWHFASTEHKAMFVSDPIKYAPQYGGYCAAEVVAGSVTIDIDPEAFKIIDGKLYLIYDKPHADEFAYKRAKTLRSRTPIGRKSKASWS